jgi:hypothetical protein
MDVHIGTNMTQAGVGRIGAEATVADVLDQFEESGEYQV